MGMKTLKETILEKLKINSKSLVNTYNYQPKDKKELEELVERLIKERGLDANLNDIDTSEITDMGALFEDLDFDGDISDWNVSNVTNMNFMFANSNFTGKNSNLNKWDVSKVRLMNGMFWESKFEGNIDNWTPPKNFKYNLIFKNCPLEKNSPKWYTK